MKKLQFLKCKKKKKIIATLLFCFCFCFCFFFIFYFLFFIFIFEQCEVKAQRKIIQSKEKTEGSSPATRPSD
ncbi:MAG: hypothetical protein N6V41_01580, partial [Candidatus Portiera aleyrodidarum]|nr:hypothetical protein [Candidatus Portiera aleyrodidarum]